MSARILLFLYNIIVVPVFVAGFYAGSMLNAKMKTGRRARKGQFDMLTREVMQAADRKRIMFHCTSAGEWLQALPIIEQLKSSYPGLFIIVSFFSPSGYHFAKNPPEVDLKLYLPLDTGHNARRLFRILKPELWIISKFDVWPNHILAAYKQKIPIVVTSATLSADSGRDKGLSKIFNKYIYSKISYFFPISEEDKNRFAALVPDDDKYTVAGDTRYDHVFNRGQRANDAGDVTIFREKKGITFIAGSTWPADEKHLLPALADLCGEFPDLRIIIVPHELHENHLSDIENTLMRFGLFSERYTSFSGKGTAEKNIVIFNTIGLLARLYKQTDISFIGGSFGKGTHNVMEPAVFGQPVIFGPNHLNSYEAGELLKSGAALQVTSREDIYNKVSLILRDPFLRKSMGEKARNLILGNTGATSVIVQQIKIKYGIIS
jgi:3-deoxy-D-manno-octulosonic-acid transferase